MAICYVETGTEDGGDLANYDLFIKYCKNDTDAVNVTAWILASNERDSQDDNIDVLRAVANFSESGVQALIMLSNSMPSQPNTTEAFSFKTPEIITIMSAADNATGAESNAHKIYRYSWNYGKNETNSSQAHANTS